MKNIFSVCFDILNIPFTFLGFRLSLMSFFLFDIVAFLLIWIVFKIFND